jgi:alkylation response protein AidB-like acyl-CoA dehydrogenase
VNLLYAPEEEALRASVRELLANRAPMGDVLRRTESAQSYDPDVWTALARDLGVAGLPIADTDGGAGATWRETAVVAEELGRSLVGTPFLGSAVVATAAVRRLGNGDLLRELAAGTTTVALATSFADAPDGPFPVPVRHEGDRLTGTVRAVADAHVADLLLVPSMGADGPAVFSVPAADATLGPVTSLDLTRPLCDLTFDGVPATELATGSAAADLVTTALTTGAAILASEQLGVAERCLELALEYVRSRHQFGRAIGSYQAIKHRLADLWVSVTQARAVARAAADTLGGGSKTEIAIAAAVGQAHCGPVAVRAAEECLQFHGGIGFTWEHPVHLYLKRAKADAIALGTARAHRARLGRLVDLAAG